MMVNIALLIIGIGFILISVFSDRLIPQQVCVSRVVSGLYR